jgi:IclR family acetate operon transcriptional repressor
VAISEAEPGVTAVAAAIRSGEDGPVVATVSVAGPGLRMPDQRVRDLAPAVIAAAGELSALWPLRLHAARRLGQANAARHRAA